MPDLIAVCKREQAGVDYCSVATDDPWDQQQVLRILIGDNCEPCIRTPAGVLDVGQECLEVGRVRVYTALRVIFFLSADRSG